jgi:hypothetical protein
VTDPAGPAAVRAPIDPFERHEARVLDPSTAVRLGGVAPATTVYRGDTLLVTADNREFAAAVIAELAGTAERLGLVVSGPDVFTEIRSPDPEQLDVLQHNRFARLLAAAEAAGVPLVVPVRFDPAGDGPAPAIDVWPLLQSFRDAADPALVAAVALDHLMFAAAVIGGSPFARGLAAIGGSPFSRGLADIGGSPFARGLASGVSQYLSGGSGGHGPVSVVLPAPRRNPDACSPHIVVLDTGIGSHPWFAVDPVGTQLTLANGDPIGLDVDEQSVKDTDPEGGGAVPDPLTGLLSSHAGHGTFIAGLLRQTCPDAQLTALRIMSGDGVVTEDQLTAPLIALATRLDQQPGSIDVLVLSLGYYAETDDANYTAGLKQLLLELARRGVVTFVAAGNDCTDRRSYPAAFADQPEFAGTLPLVAVAALNPDSSVALFSNDADWVNGEAPGANVVSTAPVLASGAWSADTRVDPDGNPRGTIDPDSFSSGFATWSGTSFAAPVLAGRYAAALSAAGCPTDAEKRRALIPVRQPLPQPSVRPAAPS